MRKLLPYFSKLEITLWVSSVSLIVLSFLAFDRVNYLTLCASLIGVTSLIFNAKGNPFGQVLMILFSLLYGVISHSFAYYGEMITYLGMTMPMAVFALVSWLKKQPRRSPGKQHRQRGAGADVGSRGACYGDLLLHPGAFSHGESPAEHAFGHHQLYSRLSDLPQMPPVRAGVRRQ